MIESLEIRRLFSRIPLLLYPCPDSVAGDAKSIINAAPNAVVASAAGNVASGQAPSQAILHVIEYHEGYSLSIYPDSRGVPTVGIGLKLDSSNASFATVVLSSAGLSYGDLAEDWNNIKSLFVRQHHPLGALRDTSPVWALFVQQNPSVADAVLTADQASTVFNYAVNAKLAAAAAFFGSKFYLLDRDPQISLVDLAYHIADLSKYQKLWDDIYGYATLFQDPTDFTLTAKQIRAGPPGARLSQWERDDQGLMQHGEYPTTINDTKITTLTLLPGQNEAAVLNTRLPGSIVYATGALGTAILLPARSLRFTSPSNDVAIVKATANGFKVHALNPGAINLTVFDSITSASANIPITVVSAAPVQVTWQASGTAPDIDGMYSQTGSIHYLVDPYYPAPGNELLVTAKAETLTFSLSLLPSANNLGFQALGPGEYGLVFDQELMLGTELFATTMDILSYDPTSHYIAGTFSTIPYGTPGFDEPAGSVSGAFSGIFSSAIVHSF